MDNPLKGTHPRFDGSPALADIERAITDLPKMPKYNKKRQWMYAIGADFGYHPDPFALVVWAFANDTQRRVRAHSAGRRRRSTPTTRASTCRWSGSSTTSSCSSAIPAGKQDDFEVWRTRMNLPIDEANKKGKNTLEEFLADDIRRGRIHLRHDSPLYDEMKHLLYLPTKPGKTREAAKHRRSGDGIVHGDHCCDAARYSYEALTHYLSKLPQRRPGKGHGRSALRRRGEDREAARRAREARRRAARRRRRAVLGKRGEYGEVY
jgi:hypothetical protein